MCSAADGLRAFVTSDAGDIIAFTRPADIAPLTEVARISAGAGVGYLYKVACDEGGLAAVVSDSLTDKVFVLLSDDKRLRLVQSMEVPGSGSLHRHARPTLSGDGLLLAIGGYLYARPSEEGSFRLIKFFPEAERIVFDERGERMLVFGEHTTVTLLIRDATGRVRVGDTLAVLGSAGDGAFIETDFALVIRGAADVDLVRIVGSTKLGSLAFGAEHSWLFADTIGRFDVDDIDGQSAAHWVMADDPLRPLPPALFMREYYEPRLLPRIMACQSAETSTPARVAALSNLSLRWRD